MLVAKQQGIEREWMQGRLSEFGGLLLKVKGEYTSECTQASVHLAHRSWDLPSIMQWELKRQKCNKIVSLDIQFAHVKFFLKSPNLEMVEKTF